MKPEPLKGKLTHIKLTPYYIDALKGAIIEKYQKQGVTDIQKLQNYIDKELPQLICDEVNSAINMLELDVRSAVEWLKELINNSYWIMDESLRGIVIRLIDEAFSDELKSDIK